MFTKVLRKRSKEGRYLNMSSSSFIIGRPVQIVTREINITLTLMQERVYCLASFEPCRRNSKAILVS